jgi:hypothetical protein
MIEKDSTGEHLKNMYYINEVFESLSAKRENISIFDIKNAPQYIPDTRGNGIFIEDAVHFTPEVNRWVAECILKKYSNN